LPGNKGIGRLQEKSLHASLKALYAEGSGIEEFPVGRYVADVKMPYGLVEIQTGNFAGMRVKLAELLKSHSVRLVYPVAEEKKVVTLNESGEVVSSRRSPKKGKPADIGRELSALRDFIGHPGFVLELVMTSEEDIRIRDGKGSWRRKGVSLADRRLVRVNRRLLLEKPADYLVLLTDGAGGIFDPATVTFTNRDLASRLGVTLTSISGLTRSLAAAGVLHVHGKKGNARLFSATPPVITQPK
jgi:hypothetical protein